MKYTIEFPDDYIKPELPGGLAWVAALRSGKYAQGENYMISEFYREEGEDEIRYCCLGVLCEIQARPKDGGCFDGRKEFLAPQNPLFPLLNKMGDFPSGVLVYGTYKRGTTNEFYDLGCLNDDGFTFLEIADIIEAIWELK